MTSIQPVETKLTFEALNQEELACIQSATLQILEDTGVRFPSERALQIFSDHGAWVDWDQQIVKLSPDLVLRSMQKAPRHYTLGSRTGLTDLDVDGRHSYFATDGCGTRTIDFDSGLERPSCKEDVAKMARIADDLSSIAFYWPMVSAQDYGRLSPLHELEASFLNTGKHVQTETVMGAELARYAIHMAETIAGSNENMRKRPPLSSLICTICPAGPGSGRDRGRDGLRRSRHPGWFHGHAHHGLHCAGGAGRSTDHRQR